MKLLSVLSSRLKLCHDFLQSLVKLVDLVGGYYDAGDNVKFGLPMAFTMTMLAWSVIEFGNMMSGQLDNARAAVRWGSDYLLKDHRCRPKPLLEVADPNQDHRCWERPEDMDTLRNVYRVTAQNLGSNVPLLLLLLFFVLWLVGK